MENFNNDRVVADVSNGFIRLEHISMGSVVDTQIIKASDIVAISLSPLKRVTGDLSGIYIYYENSKKPTIVRFDDLNDETLIFDALLFILEITPDAGNLPTIKSGFVYFGEIPSLVVRLSKINTIRYLDNPKYESGFLVSTPLGNFKLEYNWFDAGLNEDGSRLYPEDSDLNSDELHDFVSDENNLDKMVENQDRQMLEYVRSLSNLLFSGF